VEENKRKMTRREFLKVANMGLAGSLLAAAGVKKVHADTLPHPQLFGVKADFENFHATLDGSWAGPGIWTIDNLGPILPGQSLPFPSHWRSITMRQPDNNYYFSVALSNDSPLELAISAFLTVDYTHFGLDLNNKTPDYTFNMVQNGVLTGIVQPMSDGIGYLGVDTTGPFRMQWFNRGNDLVNVTAEFRAFAWLFVPTVFSNKTAS
jgi:hypothetical protein